MTDKTTILYVDDEPINVLVFEESFKRIYNIITAESGIEGLDKLHKNPDTRVVISDMKMPVMNGIDFISKAKTEFPDIVYFILTGYNITEEIADALNKKLIAKYFRKPFDIKEIEMTIEGSLK
jgi:two-component system, response regulator, stage 0 sporulation protein F